MPHNPSVFLTVFRPIPGSNDPPQWRSASRRHRNTLRGPHGGWDHALGRVMVGYGVAVSVDDEDVPLAVHTPLGVVGTMIAGSIAPSPSMGP